MSSLASHTPRSPRASYVASLLFASGACSLVYETVWLRELRLVFGASTMATAAVVACFCGGLGAGGLVLGARADAHPRPLLFYAKLEGLIALGAAVSPFLLFAVRAAYVSLGGTRALGTFGGTFARLVLTALVFAFPTLLMGGTLPAAARAIEHDGDRGRRAVALLYGVNTLGAVTGCAASTFVLFETFGTQLTLLIACVINVLVAVLARSLGRTLPTRSERSPATTEAPSPIDASDGRALPHDPPHDARTNAPASPPLPPRWFVLAAAAAVGFAFCLMELVWYRMLGPLLGGTVFTFGLILALALSGIGLGGVAYALSPREGTATMRGFAWTCLAEAALIAIPYALGDRLAVVAALTRPIGGLSFLLAIAGWTTIAGIVIVPAALASGIQFPLLIGLLGRGDRHVGRDIGLTYAMNTAGAIAGSLAGGFGLLPALGATGSWRLVVVLLAVTGTLALAIDFRRRFPVARRREARTRASHTWPPSFDSPYDALASALPLVVLAIAIACIRVSDGPTAAWRHSPIGAGRVDPTHLRTPNDARAWAHFRRRAIPWEREGRESSVAIDTADGLAFVVNGKNDGSARGDAGTTVMLGMVGAVLHPRAVTRAMVIGLGTGESAGWLAAIPSVTRVDVAELEPAIVDVARRCSSVSHDALDNPKVHIEEGDARELLLTSDRRYDLVASEPSNPYRAGVASLFTREYYAAIASRLEDDGLFLQWLQGYEVDARTVRTVYATIADVFPSVETWELGSSDLLLIGAKKPIDYDIERLRARTREEPFAAALAHAWRATNVESFLAHFVAGPSLARAIANEEATRINTDDRNIVEFGFARTVGNGQTDFSIADVRQIARVRGEDRPPLHGPPGSTDRGEAAGEASWSRVDEALVAYYIGESMAPVGATPSDPDSAHRVAALRAFDQGNARRVVAEWRAQSGEPEGPTETAILASALAEIADEDAARVADSLRAFSVAEADAVLARLRLRQGRLDEASAHLASLFERLRTDPWPMPRLLTAAIEHAQTIGDRDPHLARRLFDALRIPFVLHLHDALREDAAMALALHLPEGACVTALAPLEPNVPWTEAFLAARYRCYHDARDPRVAVAEDDLLEFRATKPLPFATGLAHSR